MSVHLQFCMDLPKYNNVGSRFIHNYVSCINVSWTAMTFCTESYLGTASELLQGAFFYIHVYPNSRMEKFVRKFPPCPVFEPSTLERPSTKKIVLLDLHFASSDNTLTVIANSRFDSSFTSRFCCIIEHLELITTKNY
jgi:hypothetical protein